MIQDQFKYLEWDSNFFGKKIYRFDLNHNTEITEFNNSILDSNADLIYVFSKHELNFNLNTKFLLVDKKIVFTKVISSKDDVYDNENIVSTKELTESLIKLSLLSGSYSRFKVDQQLNSKFAELYTTWIKKSISREIANEVFVYKQSNIEVGFVTTKILENTATIGLIAVNNNLHGKNIGSRLMKAVECWCLKNNIIELDVATQLDNIQACNFYKKNGFKSKSIDYIYHVYK